jgi:mRNA-degrading endonuclease RelE of RelBE toxin-antitoxin system
VKSRTTAQFRKAFAELPEQVQEQTRKAYRQFKQNPNHPSLRFKKVHPELPIYSARISRSYRAVGQLEGDTVIWFWVGSHAEYDRLLS